MGASLAYLLWDTYVVGDVEYVKSTVDGNEYQVRNLPDKQDASDLLANIRIKLETFVKHISKMYPDDPRTINMIQNFHSDKLVEGKDDARYTSYSINKGEKIVFCLRSRGKGVQTLMDLNTMMFVALHEMSHICSVSIGHTDEFWNNFKFILQEAIQIGIYKEQDFKSKPVEYCGMTITDSPLESSKTKVAIKESN